jgi:hypothetical protein
MFIWGVTNYQDYTGFSSAEFTNITCYYNGYYTVDVSDADDEEPYYKVVLMINYTTPYNEKRQANISLESVRDERRAFEVIPGKYQRRDGFTCYYHPYRHPLLELVDIQALFDTSVPLLIAACIACAGGIILIVLGLLIRREIPLGKKKIVEMTQVSVQATKNDVKIISNDGSDSNYKHNYETADEISEDVKQIKQQTYNLGS